MIKNLNLLMPLFITLILQWVMPVEYSGLFDPIFVRQNFIVKNLFLDYISNTYSLLMAITRANLTKKCRNEFNHIIYIVMGTYYLIFTMSVGKGPPVSDLIASSSIMVNRAPPGSRLLRERSRGAGPLHPLLVEGWPPQREPARHAGLEPLAKLSAPRRTRASQRSLWR